MNKRYPKMLKAIDSKKLEKRIRQKVEENPFSECWHWTGAKSVQGYGKLKHAGKTLYAHRVAFALWVGRINRGCDVHHKCYCRDCVNPEHLEAVSLSINRADNKPPLLEDL